MRMPQRRQETAESECLKGQGGVCGIPSRWREGYSEASSHFVGAPCDDFVVEVEDEPRRSRGVARGG